MKNFKEFQNTIKEEVSLDEMDSILDIVNYTDTIKDQEFASVDELATELQGMLNSIGLSFDSAAIAEMEDSVVVPLTTTEEGNAEAILSVFTKDESGKEVDGEMSLRIEKLGENKFDATILVSFGEDEAKELGDIEFELAEELADDNEYENDYEAGEDDDKPRSACTCWKSGGQKCPYCKTMEHLKTPIKEEDEMEETETVECQCGCEYDSSDVSCPKCGKMAKYGAKKLGEAKAVSVSQQQAAGAALAAKRGEIPASKLVGASKEMFDSMSEKELKRMASVSHSKLSEAKEDEKDGMEDDKKPKDAEEPEAPETPKEGEETEAPEDEVVEEEKKYIMTEKELRAVVSWLLKNEDKIEATEEGIDSAVAEIEATFVEEVDDEEAEPEDGMEVEDDMPTDEVSQFTGGVVEPEEDPNSPVEVYEEVRYDAAWNVILYKPDKRYFISKLFTKDEVSSQNGIEKYVQKNYPNFLIFAIYDLMEVV